MELLGTVLSPFLDPGSRTFWPALLVTLVITVCVSGWSGVSRMVRDATRASGRLDAQLMVARQLLDLLLPAASLGAGWWLATQLALALGALGSPALQASPAAVTAAYTLVLFVAWDGSRYLLHRCMHALPTLWSFHQVHHSAEQLTPLSFHRVHPVESLLYQLRGAVVTGVVAGVFFWVFRDAAVQWSLLGVHGIGLVLNIATGNLRHSHVWISWGRLERWLISPAQHQVHHSADRLEQGSNFGTWLAVWDRLGGTLRLAEAPPQRFGLDERNHGHDLWSAWFGPVAEVAGRLQPRGRVASRASWLGAMLLTALPTTAWGQDDPDGDEPADDGSYGELDELDDIIVYGKDGLPHVAGAADAIDEAELERFEYDDIQRLLPAVSGVYVRGEDGFGLRPNIGIRGANSDRSAKITLLEDGVPLAPAPYAAPAAYYFPMTTRLVGIEVFKGPAATTHGPHTVGGAINLKTREVPTNRAYGIDLAAGMRESGKMHVWGGLGDERRGILAEGVHLSSGGFKQLDGGGPTGFRRSELMVKGRLASPLDARTRNVVSLKLGFATERSQETYLGLHASDYAAQPYRRYAASQLADMSWSRTQAELSWGWSRDHLQLRTVAYHHFLDRSWTKLNRFADGPDLHALLQGPDSGQSSVFLAILRGDEDSTTAGQNLMLGTNARWFHSAGVQTRGRWEARAGKVQSTLEFGARVHHDLVGRVHTEEAHAMQSGALVHTGDDTLTTLDSTARATALSLHVHEQIGVGRLHVLPGVRVEAVNTHRQDVGDAEQKSQTRITPLPGAAVLFEAGERLDLFAGTHRGFSPVAPGAASDTKPELSWNHEAGMRMGSGERHFEVVAFANDYVNLTGQCTISGGCIGDDLDLQFNAGRVWVTGVEAAAQTEGLLAGRLWLPLQVNGTFTDTRFRNSFTSGFPQFGRVTEGESLPYVPRWTGSARTGVESLARRVSLSVGVTARSGMLDAAGELPGGEMDVPPLLLLDAAAQAAVTDRVRLYATGTNLTGSKALESWRPFGARPTAPLQVMVGVKVDGSGR